MKLSNITNLTIEGFSVNACENLQHYVYCLVNSLDNKIFYI